MVTQETAKKGTQKNVYAILTEKVIELLQKGIVPWRVSWAEAGIPENLVSRHVYKGVNRMLLASLGYKRNLFLTSKQLKELDGAILPDEKPHIVFYFSDGKKKEVADASLNEVPGTKKSMQLKYYTVFNIAQCRWADSTTFPEVEPGLEPIQDIVPTKSKDQKRSYYNPLEDFINLPAEKSYPNHDAFCYAHFHALIHSTGHFSRLNRKDLIQMSEFGYDAFSHEELVAEIGAAFLMFHHNLNPEFVSEPDYLVGWLHKFEQDNYLLYSAGQQAEKAINFLFLGEVDKVQD